ncbi:MAG: ATP-binding protein, partial [Lachnospiraceae bacterium]|nr:ATP-binding protein [Lachnospiraceae bacterium]
RSAVNLWDGDSDEAAEILKSVQRLRHPVFGLAAASTEWLIYPAQVDPTTVLSGKELAKALNFPRKSVTGLPVIECAEFGRNISSYDETENGDELHLGTIFHMNHSESTDVSLNKNSLTAHTFITGSTKAGKSNTVYKILDEARQKGVKFLVVEPAKGEYKKVFGHDKDVFVYGTNKAKTPLLRIDPFSFPKDVHVLEHLDRLIEIFNVCWPMYAAMPAVLKNAVEKSYEDCGWNLTESANEFGENLYPNFADVARNVKKIIDSSEYDTENKGAYKGSLLTRLNSLTNGINGLIFQSDELTDEELFKRNVIVDLSRIGSTETKSLIMGMLVLKLQEYRISGDEMNAELNHLTVLEEAHNLLKRTSTEQPTEGGNLLGKSVEMLSNAIAEMRTYGEGFIIADQAPGLLDMAVIRNTNTKIILRLPDLSDRELVGKAANLNDDQIAELAKLPCGVAAVYQNEWIEPVLCKVEKANKNESPYVMRECDQVKPQKVDLTKRLELTEILNDKATGSVNLSEVVRLLEQMGASSSVKVKVLKFLKGDANVKRAAAIGSLYPEVTKAVRDAYSSSSDTTSWTRAARSTLSDVAEREMQNQIIRAIITDYTCNELGNVGELKRWKEGAVI